MDVPEIVTILEQDFTDDPYGTATAVCKEALQAGMLLHGSMNDHECDILVKVSMLLNDLDPHLHITIPG